MHVCMYAYVSGYIYAYMYLCIYVCVYRCIYVYMHAWIYVYVHTCIYVCPHGCICTYIYMCIYICVCVYMSFIGKSLQWQGKGCHGSKKDTRRQVTSGNKYLFSLDFFYFRVHRQFGFRSAQPTLIFID